jgi:chemotaxis protein methyltransferase CheR
MEMVTLNQHEFDLFSSLIHREAGIFMKESKLTLLSNRLRKRLRVTNIPTFLDYYEFITQPEHKDELQMMLNAVSTNETYFFRNAKHFNVLIDKIIPDHVSNANLPVSILSAGCSTGEEAYTILMMLAENDLLERSVVDLHAVDLNTEVLQKAKEAVYDHRKLRSTPDNYRVKYFRQLDDHTYALERALTSYVSFNTMNLKTDEMTRKFDVIFCRNVMIYFDKDDQRRLVDKLYRMLNHGGYLFIGHSESLYFLSNDFKYFKIMDIPVYYKA